MTRSIHNPPKALCSIHIPPNTYDPAAAAKRAQERLQAHKTGPVIVRDTREQRGWTFDGLRVEVATLQTGDYSVRGLEQVVAIERKSHQDLYNTLATVRSRARFARELERAKELRFFALVVEVTLTDFRQPPPKPATKRLPYDRNATWRHLERLCVRYNRAPWWCSGVVQAQAVAERLLREAYLRYWGDMDVKPAKEK